MKKKLFYVLFLLTFLAIKGWTQEQLSLKGFVFDELGYSLPGASIHIKGSNKGTVADLEGVFYLNVVPQDILVVAYIGYLDQEVKVNQAKEIKIKLVPDHTALDELVITALGITKEEKKIGYATQNVDPKMMQEVAATNVGSLLTGQVAGLEVSNPPGLVQSPSFSLRGKTPLIVIDGIPIDTDFFDVSAEDIADINVLKGTSASVLYGSRGRNGAVMITTKNAKKEGVEVSLSQNIMMSAGFTVFPKTQNEYGDGSHGKYEFWDGKDGGISDGDMNWGPKFVDGLEIAQWNSPIRDRVTGEIRDWYGNVEGTIYNDKSRFERVPIAWEYHDNLKEFLETGINSKTNFSITDKGETGSYRLAGEFNYNKDKVPNSQLFRGNLSYKSTTKLSEKLTLDAKLSYAKMFSPNVPNYDYNPGGHMYTVLIWMGHDVNGKDLKNNLWVPGLEGYKQANWNYAWYNNPWFGAKYYKQIANRDVVNGQLRLSYQVTDDLVIQGRASAIVRKNKTEIESPKSYFNYSAPREGGFSYFNNDRLNVEYDILAMYNTYLTEDISFNINAGAASRYDQSNEESATTDGLTVPGLYNLGNSTGPVTAKNYVIKKAVNSVYGSVEFDFYNSFFLSFSGRNDWSSSMPKKNRSYFYPSTSLSVLLSNLIQFPKVIDYVKLYGSWAKVSTDLSPYLLQATFSPVTPTFNGNQMVTYPNSIYTDDVVPEKSNSYELGLSTSLLKKKIGVDFTYYRVIDSNFLINYPISEASGFNNVKVNGNEYTTDGFEVSLRGSIVDKEKFKWNSMINWSTRVRRLTKIHNNGEQYGDLRLYDRSDAYYGDVWMKSPEGKVILDAKTSMPIRDPHKRKLGHILPDWTLGWTNNFNYKNMSLNIGIDGIWGGVMRSEVVEKMWWGGKHPGSTLHRDQEYEQGMPVYVPNGVNIVAGELLTDVNGNVISDTRVFEQHTGAVSWQSWAQNYPYRARVTEKESKQFANMFDRTYFKLRSVAFTYDFTSLIKSKGISRLAATLTGYNLLIWKKSKGLYSDPDFHTGGANDIQDPSSRWIGLGVNVKF